MKEALFKRLEAIGKITEIKRILSVIQKSSKKQDPACVVITSGEQGEGKTTLCAGLAISAAEQNGKRILAVDFNWHTPTLHNYFDLELFNNSEELNGGKPVNKLVHHTAWDNLDVLPAVKEFQTNGSKEAGTTAWHLDLLNRTRDDYDYVFVDTSSIFPTNYRMMDPVLISKEADGVVFVALTNVTPRQKLKRASMAMKTAGADLIGVVANQWMNPMV